MRNQSTNVRAVIEELRIASANGQFHHIPSILKDAKKTGVDIRDEDIRCELYDAVVNKIRSEAHNAGFPPGRSSALLIVIKTEFEKALEANNASLEAHDIEIAEAILSAAEVEFKIGKDVLQTLRNNSKLAIDKNRMLRHNLMREFTEAIHQNNLVCIASTLLKATQYSHVMHDEPSLSAYYAMITMMCVRSESVTRNESSDATHFDNILKKLNEVRMTLETKCRSQIMGKQGSLYSNRQIACSETSMSLHSAPNSTCPVSK